MAVYKVTVVVLLAFCVVVWALSGRASDASAASEFREAIEAKKAIEVNQKTLATTGEQLAAEADVALAAVAEAMKDVNDLAQDQKVLEALRRAIPRLRQAAKALQSKHDDFQKQAEELKTSLNVAAPVFRTAAESFRQYAQEEGYQDLKADYLSAADSWDRLADLVVKGAMNYEPQTSEMDETFRYVDRTALFLERFEIQLAVEQDLRSVAERNRYLANLKRYIHTFEELRTLLRRFNTELKAQAMASGPQLDTVPPAPKPASRDAAGNTSRAIPVH